MTEEGRSPRQVEGSGGGPWDRRAPWIASALVLLLGLTFWEAFPPGIWHDDGVYVLLGRSLAQGDGLRYVGVPGAPLAPKFPPLFPLILAPVWILFPAFPENAGLLGGMNLLILAGAGGLFFAYSRNVLALPRILAAACAALAFLSPQLWRVTLVPLSEPLFVLTLTLALWSGAGMERQRGAWRVLFFILVGGLAFYTRTIGVAVLLAGSVALLVRGRGGAGIGAVLGSLAVVTPWVLWSRWAARTVPSSLQDILGSYGGWLAGEMVRDPLGYGIFLLENARDLLERALSLLLPGVTGGSLWVGLFLVPVVALGIREGGRKTALLPLALMAAGGILLVWPFQAIRLVIPFQPFLVLGAALGFSKLLTPGVLPRRGRVPVAFMAAAWVVLALGVSVYRLGTGWPGEPYRVRSEALLLAVEAVEEKTPPGAVVGAPELWASLHLFTGRSVAPSAPFLSAAGEQRPWGSPEAQYALWKEVGLTHILVEHGGLVHGEALDRVDAVCPQGTVEVLDLQPGQFLVALNWDRECQERLLGGEGRK